MARASTEAESVTPAVGSAHPGIDPGGSYGGFGGATRLMAAAAVAAAASACTPVWALPTTPPATATQPVEFELIDDEKDAKFARLKHLFY